MDISILFLGEHIRVCARVLRRSQLHASLPAESDLDRADGIAQRAQVLVREVLRNLLRLVLLRRVLRKLRRLACF